MVASYEHGTAILQSGYWRLEIDCVRPRICSLRADPAGRGHYGPEMLMPGLGGQSIMEVRPISYVVDEKSGQVTASSDSLFWSSASTSGHVAQTSMMHEMKITLTNIRIGDFATMHWVVSLTGDRGDQLSIEVKRIVDKQTSLTIDVPFGLHLIREFAPWSKPDIRLGYDASGEIRESGAPINEVRNRRVIGFHDAAVEPTLVVHGSPSYPDLELTLDAGFHHVEQRYASHVLLGISSANAANGEFYLVPGKQQWTLKVRPLCQGTLSPVAFSSSYPLMDRFVPEFFDGYMLSSMSVDHTFFGNNPSRHAFAPLASSFMAKGFMPSSHRQWGGEHTDIESRWRTVIRRTLADGVIRKSGRIATMNDSGVWQDMCGHISHEHGAPQGNGVFAVACIYALLKSGDREFAQEIFADLGVLLESLKAMDSDGDGMLESPLSGTPGSPASGYNDCLSVGHKDMYLNVVGYDAFTRYADLARWLGERQIAEHYRGKSDRIAAAVNAQMWNENSGGYCAWIDVTGKRHDHWHTFINFYASNVGIVPPAREARMLQAFLAHPNHHLIFAAGLNLEDIPDDYLVCPMKFGEIINGTIYLGPAAEEVVFRARVGGGECAWSMWRDLLARWERDGLSRTPVFVDWRARHPFVFEPWHSKSTGQQTYSWLPEGEGDAGHEPHLADGGAILWGFYQGILGIQPTFEGLRLNPRIPQDLGDVDVAIRLMGRCLRLKYRGSGDSLASVQGRRSCDPGIIPWDDLDDGAEIELHVSPAASLALV